MTKSVKWSLTAAIVVFIAALAFYPDIKRKFQGSKDEVPMSPSKGGGRNQVLNVNAEVVKFQTLTDKIMSTGSVIPDEEVNLSFESSGKITSIYFKEGSHVSKGALLAKINDQPLQAQLKKLVAQIPLAKDRVFRQRTLLERDAVSQEAFEQVQTEYDKLMADIDLVKANIAQTELRAPFDGIIGLRSVSEGAFTSPSTVIAKLTKISPLKIDFSIPERYATQIVAGTPITFRMDGALEDLHAKVYAVESKVNMETRTLNVRATYPNVRETILPGRFVSVEINMNEIKDAVAIPSEAIIPEMGKNMVYLYKSGEAKPTEIITGLRTESRVQVLEGLQPGDTLLVTGVMQLRTGMKVSIDALN